MSDKIKDFFPGIAEQIELRENQDYVPEEMKSAKTFELKDENRLFGYDERGLVVFIDEPKNARIKTYKYNEDGSLNTHGAWIDNRKVFEDYLKIHPMGPSKSKDSLLHRDHIPSFDPYQITKAMKRLINTQRANLLPKTRDTSYDR